MKISKSENFLYNLQKYLTYIIQNDSLNRAQIFESELQNTLNTLTHFPYKFRQSQWFESSNIRDLIFKGYSIPYKVLEDEIIILDIFKWENR